MRLVIDGTVGLRVSNGDTVWRWWGWGLGKAPTRSALQVSYARKMARRWSGVAI
jgi:hypothetical protein